jgi:hypothetical protein
MIKDEKRHDLRKYEEFEEDFHIIIHREKQNLSH